MDILSQHLSHMYPILLLGYSTFPNLPLLSLIPMLLALPIQSGPNLPWHSDPTPHLFCYASKAGLSFRQISPVCAALASRSSPQSSFSPVNIPHPSQSSSQWCPFPTEERLWSAIPSLAERILVSLFYAERALSACSMVTRILLPPTVPSSLFSCLPGQGARLCDSPTCALLLLWHWESSSVKPFTPLFRLSTHRDSFNGTPTSALPTRGHYGSGYRQDLHTPQVI